ncbi:MAG TPA: Sec-independent protein translocase protein TatB [Arenimonas sp.]|nr:Sec-independent protein translocase protein TatB [Arenimonas sp.]
MFDVGFSELLIIAVVALLVLGPERLPKAARFAGLWVRKARAQWYSVKSEFEYEMAQEEMKKHISDVENSIKAPALELQESIQEASVELEKTVTADLQSEVKSQPTTDSTFDMNSVVKPERSDAEEYSLYDPNEKIHEQSAVQNVEIDAEQKLNDPAQGKLW